MDDWVSLGSHPPFRPGVLAVPRTRAISAELIDGSDNSHIWGQQYSRKPSDIFALQERIAKEITKALRLRLTSEEEKRLAKSYTANPEAYQDYLKGRYWTNKLNVDGLNKGIEYFQQAIAKDPAYALAYFGLAQLRWTCKPRFCSPEGSLSKSQGGRAEGPENRRHARRSSRLARNYQKPL